MNRGEPFPHGEGFFPLFLAAGRMPAVRAGETPATRVVAVADSNWTIALA
jgi:hypothetical protein